MSDRTKGADLWVGSIAYLVGSLEPKGRSAEGKPNLKPPKSSPAPRHAERHRPPSPTLPMVIFFWEGIAAGSGIYSPPDPAVGKCTRMAPRPMEGGYSIGRRPNGGSRRHRPATGGRNDHGGWGWDPRRPGAPPEPDEITREDAPFGRVCCRPIALIKAMDRATPQMSHGPEGSPLEGYREGWRRHQGRVERGSPRR